MKIKNQWLNHNVEQKPANCSVSPKPNRRICRKRWFWQRNHWSFPSWHIVINRKLDVAVFGADGRTMNRKIVIKNSFPRHQIDQISHYSNQNKNGYLAFLISACVRTSRSPCLCVSVCLCAFVGFGHTIHINKKSNKIKLNKMKWNE